MNKIILIGRVTKDIELRSTNSGTSVVQFTLAVQRNFKNASGDYDTDFINCVAFRNQAETMKEYILKGDKIGVEGRLQVRNYKDKDDKTIYVSEVIVENIEFLQPVKKKEEVEEVIVPDVKSSYKSSDEIVINEDDLPF